MKLSSLIFTLVFSLGSMSAFGAKFSWGSKNPAEMPQGIKEILSLEMDDFDIEFYAENISQNGGFVSIETDIEKLMSFLLNRSENVGEDWAPGADKLDPGGNKIGGGSSGSGKIKCKVRVEHTKNGAYKLFLDGKFLQGEGSMDRGEKTVVETEIICDTKADTIIACREILKAIKENP